MIKQLLNQNNMKKIFLFVALFTWIGFSASAQEEKKEERKETERKMDQDNHYFIMKDGKIMEMKDGKVTEMTTETQVGDVWIRTNGQVVKKDNTIVKLKEGQYLDDQGKIHDKMNKDNMQKDKDKKDKGKEKRKMAPPKVDPLP